MKIDSNINNNPSFGKFIRITGRPNHLKRFRQEMREDSYEFLSFITNKTEKKSYLYLITGKDLDKLIDIIGKMPHFFKIRWNPEKYIKKAPKCYKLNDARKHFKKNKKL